MGYPPFPGASITGPSLVAANAEDPGRFVYEPEEPSSGCSERQATDGVPRTLAERPQAQQLQPATPS